MLQKQILAHIRRAPLCLGVIVLLASCVLSEFVQKTGLLDHIGKTDHQLFDSLNDPDLTAQEVLGMLNVTRDLDNVWIGPNSVGDILYVTQLELGACEVVWQNEFLRMKRVFEEGEYGRYEFVWDEPLHQGFNYGLARLFQHYLPQLEEFCAEHGGEVFMQAVSLIREDDQKRVEAFADQFPHRLETMMRSDILKCKDNYLKSNPGSSLKGIKKSCKTVGAKLNFAKEFKGPATATEDLPGVPPYLWAKWNRIKRVCEILFLALDKRKGPFDDILFVPRMYRNLPPRTLTRSRSMPTLRSQKVHKERFKSIKSNYDLERRLNDTSLSVEQVEAILEAVEDKDRKFMTTFSVNQVLSIRIHSIDNCLDDKMRPFHQRKYVACTHSYNFGLKIFYEHYWDKLIEYCRENMEQVIDDTEAEIPIEHLDRVRNFAANIEAKRITVRGVSNALKKCTNTFPHWFFYPHYTRKWLSDLDRSCLVLGQILEYLDLIVDDSGGKLSDLHESKLDSLLRYKKVCYIFMDDHNWMSESAIRNSDRRLQVEKEKTVEDPWWY